MNIEIIDIEGVLPNPKILGYVHEHREFTVVIDGEQYIALPGLTIKYTVNGNEKTHDTTETEFFFKNSPETFQRYIAEEAHGDPEVITTEHLQEAFQEYRNDKEKFINRVKEYYGIRLS